MRSEYLFNPKTHYLVPKYELDKQTRLRIVFAFIAGMIATLMIVAVFVAPGIALGLFVLLAIFLYLATRVEKEN